MKKTDYSKLLERIKGHDPAAEQELATGLWQGLFVTLYGQCRDRALSEDLTQDTLLVVLQRARDGTIHNPSALASFARNTAVNKLIASKRVVVNRKTTADTELVERTPDALDSPMSGAAERDLRRMVVDALAGMNQPRDRDILTRHYLAGDTKAATCAALKLSPAHYDRVLYRARQRLREQLEASGSPFGSLDEILVAALLGALLLSSSTGAVESVAGGRLCECAAPLLVSMVAGEPCFPVDGRRAEVERYA